MQLSAAGCPACTKCRIAFAISAAYSFGKSEQFQMTTAASDMAKMVRILCAIALLCVSFAHKTPVIDTQAAPQHVTAYTLPDGTFPSLCSPDRDDKGQHRGHDTGNGCEACRIASSVLLPAPADAIGAIIDVAIAQSLPIRREAFYRPLFPPNTSPRGPPADLIA
jgi:hypothetical protein